MWLLVDAMGTAIRLRAMKRFGSVLIFSTDNSYGTML